MLAANNIAPCNSFACYYNTGGHGGYVLQPTERHWHSSSTTTRYYAPSFEREISNGQTTDNSYINSPNGLVAAVKTTGTQHDVMLLATDHLGSIIGVWNASGTLLEEHRYTAWGQRTSSTASPRLRRGFTGHEHLPQFGLIDMQARLYDPHLGRFLAPDPYVQAPENHLSLNRYAYCMNNPLKYVDPTGEKWWHWLLGISTVLDPISTITTLSVTAGSAAATFTASAIDKVATGVANTVPCFIAGLIGGGFEEGLHRAGNVLKLTGSWFTADKSLSFKEQVWQIFSRHTWEQPATGIGYWEAITMNTFSQIDVSYFHGATVIQTESLEKGAGFTLGNFINIGKDSPVSESNMTLLHEYGHYLQARQWGGIPYASMAVFSLASASELVQSEKSHGNTWSEMDANARTIDYFSNKIDSKTMEIYKNENKHKYYDGRFFRSYLFHNLLFYWLYDILNPK